MSEQYTFVALFLYQVSWDLPSMKKLTFTDVMVLPGKPGSSPAPPTPPPLPGGKSAQKGMPKASPPGVTKVMLPQNAAFALVPNEILQRSIL